MAARSSAKLRQQIVHLLAEPNLNFFELSVALARLHERNLHMVSEIVAQTDKRLRRRLYYLLDAGRLIEKGELTKAQAEKVGWTKLQIIARLEPDLDNVSEEQLRSWLEKAPNVKVRFLRETLTGLEPTPTRAVVFHLNDEDRAILNDALMAYGAEAARRGLRNKEEALMKIVRAGSAAKR